MDCSSSRLRPTTDVSPAAWLEAKVRATASVVAALLPPDFEAYARILHPAVSPEEEPVRWHTVARWSGGVVHPRVQFAALAGHRCSTAEEPAPWDEPPARGELDPRVLHTLCEVLAGQTGTPRHCWFCLWDGWGWIHGSPSVTALEATAESSAAGTPFAERASRVPPALPREVLAGPRVRLPWREYLLFEGPLQAALDMGHRGPGFFFPQSPNLFWPADHAWCVATEIDLDSTYVGGSAGLIGDLLDEPRMEVVRAEPADPIGEDSDQVNG